MNRKNSQFTVKPFGAGGAHIIVPKSWIGMKIKIEVIEKKEEKTINEILS
jgi:putative transposon-encoded protein